MEKPSTLPVDDVRCALEQAVGWATANIPTSLLPSWVFVGSIALAEASGKQVDQGSARPLLGVPFPARPS